MDPEGNVEIVTFPSDVSLGSLSALHYIMNLCHRESSIFSLVTLNGKLKGKEHFPKQRDILLSINTFKSSRNPLC